MPLTYTQDHHSIRILISKSNIPKIKQFSIKYKGPILWNSIHLSIRSLKNINQFKLHLSHTLLEKYDYI